MKLSDGISCIVLSIVTIFSLVVGFLMWGWVFSIMWGWFIVPIFDAPQISVLYAMGIYMLVGMFKFKREDIEPTKSNDLSVSIANLFVYSIINPLVALFFGWIVHSLILL